jgi:hypothetical protein
MPQRNALTASATSSSHNICTDRQRLLGPGLKFGQVLSVSIFCCLANTVTWGQQATSSSTSSTSQTASQGSATIENQMIAYEILRKMAGQIANKVSATARSGAQPCTTDNPGEILLADPSAFAAITSYKAFSLSAAALQSAYAAGTTGGPHVEAFADTTSALASLLGAIKNTATYSNQNFQPTTASMVVLLGLALRDKGYSLWVTTQPGDIDAAAEKIQATLTGISQTRANADDTTRSKLDPELGAFRTALASSTPDGTLLVTVIKGEALLASLKGKGNEDKDETNYCVLTVSVDAAGGDTRIKHWFLQELIMPTPKPSYNGGVIVSYTLSNKAGVLLAGELLHYMYDFSKWKNPGVPASVNFSPPASQ